MRYPASEKLEIIRPIEGARLPVKRVLAELGVSRPTLYRWYDLYRPFGEAASADRHCGKCALYRSNDQINRRSASR